jgi:hypothetical protein
MIKGSGKATVAPEDVANAVARAAQAGERVVDEISFRQLDNTLELLCGPLALLVDVQTIPELSGITPEELQLMELSPAGTTIQIEKLNIYIEAASIVLEELQRLATMKAANGLIVDYLQRNRKTS